MPTQNAELRTQNSREARRVVFPELRSGCGGARGGTVPDYTSWLFVRAPVAVEALGEAALTLKCRRLCGKLAGEQ